MPEFNVLCWIRVVPGACSVVHAGAEGRHLLVVQALENHVLVATLGAAVLIMVTHLKRMLLRHLVNRVVVFANDDVQSVLTCVSGYLFLILDVS